ncbi:MAG: co-chaperone GroES [Opitutales bacterium]|nr:co-chaperone GroES [Opitutales bacterium]NRA26213.1 co-chaperone GroES [Opitutales bacterium]
MTTVAVNIKPLGDRVLVKAIEEDEQIRGGIIIPDAAKEKSQEAEVVSLGTGRKNDDGSEVPFEVSVGDKVLVSQYGGSKVKVEGIEYTVLREDDIIAIVG